MSRLGDLRNRVLGGDKPPETKPGGPPAPFIVGAPRSGTTMLRLMMDAHRDLAIPPETYFIVKAAKMWRHHGRPHRNSDQLDAAIEAIATHKRWPDFHLDADAYRERARESGAADLTDAVRVFYEMYAEKRGKPRWGDKTPFYVRKMDVIQDVLPEARFVHLVRDGRGVATSIMGLWFGPDTIEDAAHFWVERIDEAREQAKKLDHYMEVRYEDVVRDTEPALRRICEFSDLDWDPALLTYHETVTDRIQDELPPEEIAPDGRVVSTAEREKIMENVSRPPDPSRLERWRTDLSPEDRAKFEAIAGERLAELGYPLD